MSVSMLRYPTHTLKLRFFTNLCGDTSANKQTITNPRDCAGLRLEAVDGSTAVAVKVVHGLLSCSHSRTPFSWHIFSETFVAEMTQQQIVRTEKTIQKTSLTTAVSQVSQRKVNKLNGLQ